MDSRVIINLIPAKQNGPEGKAAFAASMDGLAGLTRLAGRELSPYGIRVYAVESKAETVVKEVFSLLDPGGRDERTD